MISLNKLSRFHLGLTALLMMFSLLSAILLFIGVGLDLSEAPTGTRGLVILYGVINLVNAAALACGIVYIMNGYAKRFARIYQAFLFLLLVQTLFHIYVAGAYSIIGLTGSLVPLTQVLMAVKVGVLSLIVFAKDLGEKRTRVLVGILMIVDVAYAVLMGDTADVMLYRAVSILTRLSFDVTILLAVFGKYADKVRRGSK